MVKLVWIVFSLLAALWTALAWATGAAVRWAAEAAAGSGSGAGVIEAARSFELPGWAGLWIDPALFQALKSMALDLAQWLQAWAPAADTAAGWLVAAVWIGWGLGLLVLLSVAGVSHLLARRVPRLAPAG